MTKRTSKTSQPKKPRAKATKAKVGGARPGSGPKPKLGAGAVRSVIKTVRLSAGEHDAQLAAVVRGGAKDWAEWARPILNGAANEIPGLDRSLGAPPMPIADIADLGMHIDRASEEAEAVSAAGQTVQHDEEQPEPA